MNSAALDAVGFLAAFGFALLAASAVGFLFGVIYTANRLKVRGSLPGE